MEKIYKVVIDTKGSDKGPAAVVKGAVDALAAQPMLAVCLVGDADFIAAECERLGAPTERVEIIDAPDAITNYDNPAEAIFTKGQSSMVKALVRVAGDESLIGLITAGNTGALLAGSVRYLSGKERVRPAMAAVLPAANGSFTCLVDTGATIDCPAATLVHFARLGSDFMKKMYGIESPRVGLLSNGAEPTKGNKVVKETHQLLLCEQGMNFIGNIEGNNALSGECDVLVCDGFAGNQVLKVTEGTATRIITDIVKYAKRTGNPQMMELVGHLMGIYDINSLGGGIILGCATPVVKVRGSSGDKAIVSAAQMLLNMAQNKSVYDKQEYSI